ncbi:MAG TPA: BrnT family toxin [Steroidobacteraceae bacterium]|nr:BrnT family toxin [Steroidobacteraceae bacterium]
MTERFVYRLDWDISKAMVNWRKHGVSFEVAATVFRDPLALSRYDAEHSQSEERWITLGQTESGQLVVVVHTFEELRDEARIRIISARSASAHERRQYESS